MTQQVSAERIEHAILFIRGHRVLLDADLALLYGVSVGRLNESVKRNRHRFPDDFMFQLSDAEFQSLKAQVGNLKSQFAISSFAWGGRRHPPYAFTEQGVAMLSSVLRSKRAVEVNIEQPCSKLRGITSAMRFVLKASPPNVFIGGPVPDPPGFPLKACGNDGLRIGN